MLLAAIVAGPTPAPPAPGLDPNVRIGAQTHANAIDLAGKISQAPRRSEGPVAAAATQTVSPPVRRLEPIPCYAPGAAICGRDAVLCEPAADNAPRTLYWEFTGPPGVANPTQDQWEFTDQVCLTPAQAAAGQPGTVTPVLTAEQFRRLPLPAGVVHIQPGNGRTLVNVPTNVYVDARTVVLPTTVLGRAVQVRASPVTYSWAFGDGHGLRTADRGAPYPDLRLTHIYVQPATVKVSLTTTYRGEYSVEGGAWLPVDGTATVTSAPQALTVVATRAELVADTLPT